MAEEFGEATMETEVSLESGEVQWMRQGVVIQAGPRHTLGQSGCRRSLTMRNLTLSDRGTYRCETLHDRTQVKLNVERKRTAGVELDVTNTHLPPHTHTKHTHTHQLTATLCPRTHHTSFHQAPPLSLLSCSS